VHPGRHEVLVNRDPIHLTLTEFDILYHLAQRSGWVFTRRQIVGAVRGSNYVINERSVDAQIYGLRKKLGPAARYIETVRRVGYRFKS
jgi:two-component system phosphate regulon response regulator PhoB